MRTTFNLILTSAIQQIRFVAENFHNKYISDKFSISFGTRHGAWRGKHLQIQFFPARSPRNGIQNHFHVIENIFSCSSDVVPTATETNVHTATGWSARTAENEPKFVAEEKFPFQSWTIGFRDLGSVVNAISTKMASLRFVRWLPLLYERGN